VQFNFLMHQLKLRKRFSANFFILYFLYTQKYINKSWKKTQKMSLIYNMKSKFKIIRINSG